MKKEIAEAWVADLRTNPKQAKGTLCDGKGHCCLGRLCLVLGATFVQGEYDDEPTGEFRPVLNGSTLSEHEVLPNEIRELTGMGSQTGHYEFGAELTELNDKGSTFAEIADVIEKKWETL